MIFFNNLRKSMNYKLVFLIIVVIFISSFELKSEEIEIQNLKGKNVIISTPKDCYKVFDLEDEYFDKLERKNKFNRDWKKLKKECSEYRAKSFGRKINNKVNEVGSKIMESKAAKTVSSFIDGLMGD